jgi:AcrR family transcriptional regulator
VIGMTDDPQRRRAARHAAPVGATAEPTSRKRPLTVERITDAALEVVAGEGYDALTMRSVAARLETGPASLYAHVVNKADLDELVIGRLCTRVALPAPDPTRWREQVLDVCAQLRDQYLAYPGISSAALATVVTNLDVLRVTEGMLAVLLAGGVPPRAAAWAIDALLLYIGAYTLEISLAAQRQDQREGEWVVSREEQAELVRRFRALPAEQFPSITRYAAELTSGRGHERFDFTLGLIVANLAADGAG